MDISALNLKTNINLHPFSANCESFDNDNQSETSESRTTTQKTNDTTQNIQKPPQTQNIQKPPQTQNVDNDNQKSISNSDSASSESKKSGIPTWAIITIVIVAIITMIIFGFGMYKYIQSRNSTGDFEEDLPLR